MTKRPGQWELLDHSSDPLDADLHAVAQQGNHYASVADLIQQQAARLRSIGSGDNDLVGKYAASLKDKAGELADDLAKTHGRYEAVGSALKTYYPALDTALTETWAALQDAITANHASQSASGMPNPTAQPGKTLTPEQTTQVGQRTAAAKAAGGQLDAAKSRLSTALSDLNDVAKRVAGQIRDSFHDGLTDSFWDKFKSFLVEFVKVVVDIAGYIAIACAIVMLFVPGLDILATIALAATIASLVGHTALAATGNGSWLDVAVDVFALATFGLGRFAAGGLRASEEATAEAGTRAAARSQSTFNRQLSSLDRRIATGSGKARIEAITERSALKGTRPIRAAEFSRELRVARSDTSTAWQFGGDMDQAGPYNAIRRSQALLPNSAGVTRASSTASRYATVGRTVWAPGQAVPALDKAYGQSDVVPGHHGNESYNRFKQGFTYQVIPW